MCAAPRKRLGTLTGLPHNILGQIRDQTWRAAGRRVCKHDEEKVWFKIEVKRGDLARPVNAAKRTGWVRVEAVNGKLLPPAIQAATALAVRAWPDGPALDGGTLAAQQRYALIGPSFDGAWWQVRLAANRAGWVRQDAVTAQGYRNYVPVKWRFLARVKDGTSEDMSVWAALEKTQRGDATRGWASGTGARSRCAVESALARRIRLTS